MRIVVLLMDRKREYACRRRQKSPRCHFPDARPYPPPCARSIARVELQPPNGDRYVVNRAKSFAVIRAGVMESAADVGRPAVGQSALPRQDRAARCQPTLLDHFLRVGNLQSTISSVRLSDAGLELAHVILRMDAQHVFVASRLRARENPRARRALRRAADRGSCDISAKEKRACRDSDRSLRRRSA